MKTTWLFLVSFILLLNGCSTDEETGTTQSGNVSVYINTWGSWKAKNIKGEYLSDLILAFALINQNTAKIYVNGFAGLWDEVAELKQTWPELKITLSVGGATERGFSTITADAGKRAAFTADVCAWMVDRNLDGVDIDWEFPRNAGEWRNYISLLNEMRNALDALETGKQYSLSTAVSATYHSSMLEAAEIVDTLKVMNYDYYGGWSGTTGYNANLYNNPRRSGEQSTDKSITSYLKAGIPSEKIMLGVAFYGKVWNGVSAGSYVPPGLYQPYSTYGTEPTWTTIKSYLREGSGYTRYWDEAAATPVLYNESNKRWVTYTDPQQIRRLTAYAREKGLGGVFAWEYSQDSGAELLKALAE
jgi:chitinase